MKHLIHLAIAYTLVFPLVAPAILLIALLGYRWDAYKLNDWLYDFAHPNSRGTAIRRYRALR